MFDAMAGKTPSRRYRSTVPIEHRGRQNLYRYIFYVFKDLIFYYIDISDTYKSEDTRPLLWRLWNSRDIGRTPDGGWPRSVWPAPTAGAAAAAAASCQHKQIILLSDNETKITHNIHANN